MTDRDILLAFIGSLTLCDNMGDVADDITAVLKQIGFEVPEWGDLEELGDELGKLGIKTLHGTPLWVDEDQELGET